MPTLKDIEEAIGAGLPDGSARRDAARVALDYYEMRNRLHDERRDGETNADYHGRPRRYSRMTRKAVGSLCSLLYTPGPQRKVESEAARQALELVWSKVQINYLLSRADRMATLNDACAILVAASGDPGDPARLWLYGAEEFEPFFTDDDPITPWAVCTITQESRGRERRRRIEAWDADSHRVYHTRWSDWGEWLATAGGTAYTRTSSEPNPYGCLPFAFVWNDLPVASFWGSGIGPALVECNREVDERLCDLAEHMRWCLNPKVIAKNVSTEFRWTDRPGQPTHLPAANWVRGGETTAEPALELLAPEPRAEAAWWDVRQTINQTFYELDVPLSSIRDDQSPTSGVQVIAESKDLVGYTKARQSKAAWEEARLSRTILRVLGHYYGAPELVEAADDLEVSHFWPEVRIPVPSIDQDQSDQFEVDQKMESPVGLLMRRRGLTRAQAEEQVAQVADDAARIAELYGLTEADPAATTPDLPGGTREAGPSGDDGETPA